MRPWPNVLKFGLVFGAVGLLLLGVVLGGKLDDYLHQMPNTGLTAVITIGTFIVFCLLDVVLRFTMWGGRHPYLLGVMWYFSAFVFFFCVGMVAGLVWGWIRPQRPAQDTGK